MKLSKGTQGAAVLTATAVAGLLLTGSGTARAAVTGDGATASMTFQSTTVAAGTRPQLTFITSGAPAGTVVYVQEERQGHPWHSIGRIHALSGTVDAPADAAGSYEYRVRLTSAAGTVIATSAPVALTVTGANGTTPAAPAAPAAPATQAGSGCSACHIVGDALPWLALLVDPGTVWTTITSILSDIGGAILAFIGL